MALLKDKLLDPTKRPALVRDCARLLDDEVAAKGGLSGLPIKAAFKVVKAVKPGFIEHVIDGLLDDWVHNLEGHFARWHEGGAPASFGSFVARDAGAVAEQLLAVTGARSRKGDNKAAIAAAAEAMAAQWGQAPNAKVQADRTPVRVEPGTQG